MHWNDFLPLPLRDPCYATKMIGLCLTMASKQDLIVKFLVHQIAVGEFAVFGHILWPFVPNVVVCCLGD